MTKPKYEITFPQEVMEQGVSQAQEYFFVHIDGVKTRIDLHDYKTVYRYPWLYEAVVCDSLGYRTPSGMCDIIDDLFTELNVDRQRLHMLEIGAGSGVFAENLRDRVGITDISGLDIHEIAKVAAKRDRPNLYRKYYVADLTDLPPDLSDELTRQRFNCVGVASAAGWGNHIPVDGFEKAFDLLVPGGWFIFHVKSNTPDPECIALSQWIDDKISAKQLDLKTKQSCFHRYSMAGETIYFDVLVGIKQSFE